MKQDREKLRARLRALLAKTVENGCTEAEAVAAAEKAAELMHAFAVDADDLEICEDSIDRGAVRATPRDRLWATLAWVTNTSSIVVQDWSKTSTVFVGMEPGPQIATYLYVVCDRAIDREVRLFKQSVFYKRRRSLTTKRQAVADFTLGMAVRLSTKLRELFKASINDSQRQAAKNALVRRNPNSVSRPLKERRTRYSEATAEGWLAGNNVDLQHGVGGQSETLKIGGAA